MKIFGRIRPRRTLRPQRSRRIVRAFFLRDGEVYAVAFDRGDGVSGTVVVIVDILRLDDRFFVRDDLEQHFPLPRDRAHVALFVLEASAPSGTSRARCNCPPCRSAEIRGP